MVILPTTYLGGTEWFRWLARGGGGNFGGVGVCVIDVGENWVKQTARNRCEIMTSGGVTTLTVPVYGGNQGGQPGATKIATKDVRIDNSKRWQHQHWVSLVSAYKKSPFFDHYEGRFAPIYNEKKFNFLTDLNAELLNILTSILKLGDGVQISENYVIAEPDDVDLRGKKALRRLNNLTSSEGNIEGYTQVFSDREEFVEGLSIVDLLFCEGPAARDYLAQASL